MTAVSPNIGIRSNMSRQPAVCRWLSLNPQLSTLNHLTGVCLSPPFLYIQYFDEIRQFLPGIEIYPFAGLVQIAGTYILCIEPTPVLVS